MMSLLAAVPHPPFPRKRQQSPGDATAFPTTPHEVSFATPPNAQNFVTPNSSEFSTPTAGFATANATPFATPNARYATPNATPYATTPTAFVTPTSALFPTPVHGASYNSYNATPSHSINFAPQSNPRPNFAHSSPLSSPFHHAAHLSNHSPRSSNHFPHPTNHSAHASNHPSPINVTYFPSPIAPPPESRSSKLELHHNNIKNTNRNNVNHHQGIFNHIRLHNNHNHNHGVDPGGQSGHVGGQGGHVGSPAGAGVGILPWRHNNLQEATFLSFSKNVDNEQRNRHNHLVNLANQEAEFRKSLPREVSPGKATSAGSSKAASTTASGPSATAEASTTSPSSSSTSASSSASSSSPSTVTGSSWTSSSSSSSSTPSAHPLASPTLSSLPALQHLHDKALFNFLRLQVARDYLSSTPRTDEPMRASSVSRWLQETRVSTETECMCILQSKSIGRAAAMSANDRSASAMSAASAATASVTDRCASALSAGRPASVAGVVDEGGKGKTAPAKEEAPSKPPTPPTREIDAGSKESTPTTTPPSPPPSTAPPPRQKPTASASASASALPPPPHPPSSSFLRSRSARASVATVMSSSHPSSSSSSSSPFSRADPHRVTDVDAIRHVTELTTNVKENVERIRTDGRGVGASLAKASKSLELRKWRHLRAQTSMLCVDVRALLADQRQRRRRVENADNEEEQKNIRTTESKILKLCGKLTNELEGDSPLFRIKTSSRSSSRSNSTASSSKDDVVGEKSSRTATPTARPSTIPSTRPSESSNSSTPSCPSPSLRSLRRGCRDSAAETTTTTTNNSADDPVSPSSSTDSPPNRSSDVVAAVETSPQASPRVTPVAAVVGGVPRYSSSSLLRLPKRPPRGDLRGLQMRHSVAVEPSAEVGSIGEGSDKERAVDDSKEPIRSYHYSNDVVRTLQGGTELASRRKMTGEGGGGGGGGGGGTEKEKPTEQLNDDNNNKYDAAGLSATLSALTQTTTHFIDQNLSFNLGAILIRLRDHVTQFIGGDASRSTLSRVRHCITALISLGLEGENLCRLTARAGGVRLLLEILQEEALRAVWAHALRCLATLCCAAESIARLEARGGLETLTRALRPDASRGHAHSSSETIRSEAAGVVAQITSPCLDHGQPLPRLHAHLRPMIEALTSLASSTGSRDVFLLAAAALANLSFVSPDACDAMASAGTASALLRRAAPERQSAAGPASVFARDQIATVVTNMAAHADCHEDIRRGGGVDVVLAFLKEEMEGEGKGRGEREGEREGEEEKGRPSPNKKSTPVQSAAERVQQKSAIALTRLSSNSEEVAKEIVEKGGHLLLATLCRNSKKRNFSDAVLVACLAALRKIQGNCGPEAEGEFETEEMKELIRPKLLDSFLSCSQMQESFV